MSIGQQPGDLGRCPTVTPCRGPHATRFQLLGDGGQRRFTGPPDLRYHGPRRGVGLGRSFEFRKGSGFWRGAYPLLTRKK
jgi:hypothetical protein